MITPTNRDLSITQLFLQLCLPSVVRLWFLSPPPSSQAMSSDRKMRDRPLWKPIMGFANIMLPAEYNPYGPSRCKTAILHNCLMAACLPNTAQQFRRPF